MSDAVGATEGAAEKLVQSVLDLAEQARTPPPPPGHTAAPLTIFLAAVGFLRPTR